MQSLHHLANVEDRVLKKRLTNERFCCNRDYALLVRMMSKVAQTRTTICRNADFVFIFGIMSIVVSPAVASAVP